jgi:SpoVK/Ycf46/Vps4 family AAA+-type ATPase
LILPAALKDDIRADITSFFASRDVYARYRIPWKRGILFLGPPGNGKTHAVKALLNEVNCTCLYVKTFDLPHGHFPQAGVAAVFEHARRSTPCIIVLEDLDSLVGDHNRSFFLNELDGFAANNGVIVLATTNHPERLDPAILDRPSRFDRKYHFDLPAQAERERYLRHWNTSLASELTLDEATVLDIADKSEGFSFAYLRELFLSSSVRWISDGATSPFATVLRAQLDVLREQMTAARGDAETLGSRDAGGLGQPRFMSPQLMSLMMQRRYESVQRTMRP